MATRLYPKTQTPEVLEALAGVPAGTFAIVAALEKQERAESRALTQEIAAAEARGEATGQLTAKFQEISNKYYNKRAETPHASKLDGFLTFGWGRLTQKASALVAVVGSGDAFLGQTRKVLESMTTGLILKAQGVELPEAFRTEDIEGLCWN